MTTYVYTLTQSSSCDPTLLVDCDHPADEGDAERVEQSLSAVLHTTLKLTSQFFLHSGIRSLHCLSHNHLRTEHLLTVALPGE